MGNDIPVMATLIDKSRFAFNALKDVDSPPGAG